MKTKLLCPHCGYEFNSSIELDELGWHSSCPKCKESFDVDKPINVLFNMIVNMLPREPRSYDTSDDPGFWTNGEEILCPSKTELIIVKSFLEDTFSEWGVDQMITGYYDPYEDYKSQEQDDCTGFYYLTIE